MPDRVWEILERHLPGRNGTRGVPWRDNRNLLNADFEAVVQIRGGEIGSQTMKIEKILIAVFFGGKIGGWGKIA